MDIKLNNKKADSIHVGGDPLVSVIIPLYNHEKYIKEAVTSVLDQSFPDFELIIIDDGSKDRSGDIVKSIKDDRITYIYQENRGAHNTINEGIKMAKGKYISILNSDDIYEKNKLQEGVRILEQNPNIQAVFSHFDIIYADHGLYKIKNGSEDNWISHNEETSFKGEGNILLDLLAGNFLGTTSNLFCRKSIFDEIGYFANFRYDHDYDFFLRLCSKYEVYLSKKSLFKYRIHDSNTINENFAVAYFEVAVILTDFFLKNSFSNILQKEKLNPISMIKFFNSICTFKTDRVVFFLLLLCLDKGDREILKELRDDSEHPLRKAIIAYLRQCVPLKVTGIESEADVNGSRKHRSLKDKFISLLVNYRDKIFIKEKK